MDSDNDYQSLSPLEEASSPVRPKKLKRLKKTVCVLPDDAIDQTTDPIPSTDGPDDLNSADPELSETLYIGELEDPMRSVSASEGFGDEKDLNCEFDDMVTDRPEDRRAMDVQEGIRVGSLDAEVEVFDGNGDDRSNELEGELVDLKLKKPVKKRLILEGPTERKEKKKKRVKVVGDVEKPKAHVQSKRRADKDRKAHLEQLHAESQRLLRETRDAAFKPVTLVQKPISSILEKIRQRKLEISKKAGILNSNDILIDNNCSPKEIFVDICAEQSKGRDKGYDKCIDEEIAVCHLNTKSNLDVTCDDDSSGSETIIGCENNPYHSALDEESKHAFRTPINDTQELFSDSETSGDEYGQPNDQSKSPNEEVLAPSLLTTNLKLDSVPPDENSSDEEDDDKENIDPHLHKLVNAALSPKGDPVKAFVDDEAVEEDDSDNDLRFGENDEDDENGFTEELKDLIATGYEEKTIDCERRDELHQKWLEQQDVAETENVLQRLKCGWKQREPKTFEDDEDDDEEDEEFSEESLNEAADGTVFTNITRINSKKVKQMIPQMFTDKDDIFLSDDEETEHRLVRQRILEKTEEASLLSPAEDESSREVFGLIKKLNIVHDTKKKGKTSSFFDMLITGGNSNSSSKSSFLGRAANNSLPSSHRNGSSNVRSFIFGRDDSNSRSAISSSEVSPDMSQREKRNVSAKFSNSQSKSSQNIKKVADSSLFEILKGSMQSNRCARTSMIGQTQTVFAAFKSGKKSMKIERT